MRYCQLALLWSSWIVWAASADAAAVAGTVELELVGDTQGAAMTFQDLGPGLGRRRHPQRADAHGRGAGTAGHRGPGDRRQPALRRHRHRPSATELDLPGRRFRRSEVGRLAEWLEDVAAQGPPEQREAKSAFGLSASQFARVRKDLATPVGFSTAGMAADGSRREDRRGAQTAAEARRRPRGRPSATRRSRTSSAT